MYTMYELTFAGWAFVFSALKMVQCIKNSIQIQRIKIYSLCSGCPPVLRSHGPLVRWSAGPPGPLSTRSLVHGPLVQWSTGPFVFLTRPAKTHESEAFTSRMPQIPANRDLPPSLIPDSSHLCFVSLRGRRCALP